MTDTTLGEDPHRDTAHRYGFIGTALVVLALAAAFIAAAAGPGTAHSVGEQFGGAFGTLLVMAGIAWLVTRKSSTVAKAKGRLVVGILLCIAVGNNIVRVRGEHRLASDFMRGAVEMSSRQQAQFEALNKRFDEITVGQYTTAEALASAQAMAAAQQSLEKYRALLGDRRALLQSSTAESQAFVNGLTSPEMKRAAESKLMANIQVVRGAFGKLDVAQTAHADALGELFSWAQRNAGKLTMQGAQLVLQTPRQQQELRTLATKLEDAESRVDQAVKEANIEMAKVAGRREQAMKEGAALLGESFSR